MTNETENKEEEIVRRIRHHAQTLAHLVIDAGLDYGLATKVEVSMSGVERDTFLLDVRVWRETDLLRLDSHKDDSTKSMKDSDEEPTMLEKLLDGQFEISREKQRRQQQKSGFVNELRGFAIPKDYNTRLDSDLKEAVTELLYDYEKSAGSIKNLADRAGVSVAMVRNNMMNLDRHEYADSRHWWAIISVLSLL
jgi:hypothetical protein